jgi:hypothetical protein
VPESINVAELLDLDFEAELDDVVRRSALRRAALANERSDKREPKTEQQQGDRRRDG